MIVQRRCSARGCDAARAALRRLCAMVPLARCDAIRPAMIILLLLALGAPAPRRIVRQQSKASCYSTQRAT